MFLMKKNFSIRLISNDEIQKVTDWARLEGFAPGFDDISIYKNTDKKGIWVGCLDNNPINPYEELYLTQEIEPIGTLSRHPTHIPFLSVFL